MAKAGYVMTSREVLLAVGLAAAACADVPPDSPPPESAAPEGVYGVAPRAVAGTPSVITLHPTGSAQAPPAGAAPRMDQLGLAFTPPFLVTNVGESVLFTNSETIAHNVHVEFSDNDSTVLHYNTDPAGSVEFVFDREGGYEVTCELHPGMRAFVYATTAPFGAFADYEGRFHIAGIPAGSYTLSLWSVDPALRSERTIDVTGSSTEVR